MQKPNRSRTKGKVAKLWATQQLVDTLFWYCVLPVQWNIGLTDGICCRCINFKTKLSIRGKSFFSRLLVWLGSPRQLVLKAIVLRRILRILVTKLMRSLGENRHTLLEETDLTSLQRSTSHYNENDDTRSKNVTVVEMCDNRVSANLLLSGTAVWWLCSKT